MRIENDGTVVIEAPNLIIKSENSIDFDSKQINFHADDEFNINVKGEIYIGAEHIINQAKRIDMNPKEMTGGYLNKEEIIDIVTKLIEERELENEWKVHCTCGRCSSDIS